MSGELNGDLRLGASDRLRYLSRNFTRNLKGGSGIVAVRWRNPPLLSVKDSGTTSSPLRYLSETFIRRELPRLHPAAEVSVLDVGCGSGRLAILLADAGYRGQYTGVDMADRFSVGKLANGPFRTRFVAGDAHSVPLDGPFDLIFSVSALEHIEEDGALVKRLDRMLAAGGVQIHLVPAPAALLIYLWHGYRQYSTRAIAERFGTRDVDVYGLGGGATWLLHFLSITVPEVICRMSMRHAMPHIYANLLHFALRLDRLLPAFPLVYAVVKGS